MAIIESAGPSDMSAIRELVAAAGLTVEGLGEVPVEVFVAREGDRIVATAAVERHGKHGLLRSVAVDAACRHAGIGSAVVAAAEHHAAADGLDGLYLLTDTAAQFFARRGYVPVGRSDAPPEIMRSVEWAGACGESATPMVLRAQPV